MPVTTSEDEDDADLKKNPPAWEDSDDERILVSLGSEARLRKLRRTEEEDIINGKEYTRRLRKQYVYVWRSSVNTKLTSLGSNGCTQHQIGQSLQQ